jgi:hypothetical protein
MYSVDDLDTVVEMTEIPAPNAGAPLPTVVADDDTVLLAYIVSTPNPHWDGRNPVSVSPQTTREAIAIIRFETKIAHMFGPPNDEAFSGHPLASRGLTRYSVSEVHRSSWVRRLEQMNAVHPHHDVKFFAKYRHFVFAFHDSTFECIAENLTFRTQIGTIQSALSTMVETLAQKP